jgi:hypothetical protein
VSSPKRNLFKSRPAPHGARPLSPREQETEQLRAEFLALKASTGWSQSEIARRLFKTPAYVNMIVNQRARVERSLVELFKLTIRAERPELRAQIDQWEQSGGPGGGAALAGSGRRSSGVPTSAPRGRAAMSLARSPAVEKLVGELEKLDPATRAQVAATMAALVGQLRKAPGGTSG